MVRDGRPNLEETGAERSVRAGPSKPERAVIADDGPSDAQPLRATVDAVFRREQLVTDSIKENLRPRTLASDAIAERARKAFKDFSPSSYSADERARRTYLSPADDLAKTLDGVAKESARGLKKADRSRGVRLTRTPALDELIKQKNGSSAGTIGHLDLVDYVMERLGTSPSLVAAVRSEATAACNVEDEAEKRLTEIENGRPAQPSAHAGADRHQGHDGGSGDGDVSTKELVKAKVGLLMDTVVSPEHPIRIDPPERTAGDDVSQGSIQTFELRDGPADVTSYHDFSSLQIAFQHVWTELFDTELEALGKELYQEYVRLKDFSGLDDGKDDPISTVDDLARLIGEVKELSKLTQDELPAGSTGDGTSRNVPVGTRDLRDDPLYKALTGSFIGNDAAEIALNPVGFGIDLLANLFAGLTRITWGFLEDGHLPGGIDILTATIDENAVTAGTVEIVLTTSASAGTWKGVDFTELDTNGRPVDVRKISNHPNETNTMRLATHRVKNGVLAFGKEITFGIHKAQYLLTDLDEKLEDRSRVTFNWEKDK